MTPQNEKAIRKAFHTRIPTANLLILNGSLGNLFLLLSLFTLNVGVILTALILPCLVELALYFIQKRQIRKAFARWKLLCNNTPEPEEREEINRLGNVLYTTTFNK